MNVTAAIVSSVLMTTGFPGLQGILDMASSDQDVPGVSAVVTRKNEVLFSGASGVADLETGRKMSADTVLYAGSLTKIFTSVLILQLVDEGRLSLDDVVDGIAVTSGRTQADITVAHLLTHSSGLVREGDFGYWFNAEFPDGAGLANFLLATELRARPGATVSYSNIGFAALGPVIENASGKNYHDALAARVLRPLGMGSTGSPGPIAGIAAGYTPSGRLIPSEERPFAGVGREVEGRHVREYHNAKAMTPAFGAYTTANDLSLLARFLLGFGDAGILSDELRRQMLQPQASRRTLGLGTGRYESRPIARHGGWFAAHKSEILVDLEAYIGVVVLANSDSADPGVIAKALLGEVLNGGPGTD